MKSARGFVEGMRAKGECPHHPGQPFYHCFSGDVRFLTWDGVRTFNETVGTVQRILPSTPYWADAEIRHFGVQPTYEIILTRNQKQKIIRATSGHRWFVDDWKKGRHTHSRKIRNGSRREIITENLRPKMKLAIQLPFHTSAKTRVSGVGAAAGFIFGDDTRLDRGSTVILWGDKDSAMVPYFAGYRTEIVNEDGREGIRVWDLPGYFKRFPDPQESPAYLLGWLAGYFAADGSVDSGCPVLWSATAEHLEFVQVLANRLGIPNFGVRSKDRRGYGDDPSKLFSLAFVRSRLREDFFLLPSHREHFSSGTPDRLGWRVVSISSEPACEEPVFCAVVPDHQAFTLDDYILVGNCPECSKIRQQKVGGEIADALACSAVEANGQSRELVADPVPVHITQRAQEHLLAAVRDFRRQRIEGKVLAARQRVDGLPPIPDPEAEISQRHLDRLEMEADEAGVEVEGFDVVVRVSLDSLGVSGISPQIDLVEPLLVDKFGQDYRVYEYGSLQVAVELQHMNYLRGLIIEWHDRLDASGFVIRHIQGEWTVQDR